MNSAKQAGYLFSPQSSLVIVYANGMYGMLASAHNEQRVGSVFVKQEAAKEDEELKFVSLSFFH